MKQFIVNYEVIPIITKLNNEKIKHIGITLYEFLKNMMVVIDVIYTHSNVYTATVYGMEREIPFEIKLLIYNVEYTFITMTPFHK